MMDSPNIAVIVIDALRADRVLGNKVAVQTPAIDTFADEAATFSNAFSTTNVTDPAVTSISTGRYPLSHGILNHGKRIMDEEKRTVEQIRNIQGVLSGSGYRTGKFGRPLGRWHRQGFDIYPDSMEGREAFDQTLSTFEKLQGWLTYIESSVGTSLDQIHPTARTKISDIYHNIKAAISGFIPQDENGPDIEIEGRDNVVRNVQDFIHDPDPFYAFIHLMDTHAPYTADVENVISLLRDNDYPVKHVKEAEKNIPTYFTERILSGKYPEIKKKYYFNSGTPSSAIVDAHYDAAVEHADTRVGRIIQTLKQKEIYDNTIIFLLADHGESLTEHGIYYDHHGLYDVTTHVPLFVRVPGGTSETIEQFVQITDIAPTIESYIGTNQLNTEGKSLRPAINGEEFDGREYVLAEEAHTQRRRMIRTHDSKLIYSIDDDTICRYCDIQHAPEIELYDLSTDPVENENVATKRPDTVDSLQESAERSATAYENNRPTIDAKEEVDYEDEETIHEHLEALGYK